MQNDSLLKCTRFRTGLDERSTLKPLQTSFIITLAYIVFVSLYIFLSGKVAFLMSSSIEQLSKIEFIKGILYTLSTGIVLLLFIYYAFKKIADQDNQIISKNKSIASTERLVMAGIFSSSVCHDINNLMSIVKGNIDFLYESESIDHKDKEYIKEISDASDRMIKLVKRMMDAGKGYIPGEKKYENLSNHVLETIDFAKIHNKIKTCQVEYDIQPDLHLNINSILIARTLMNLILNSADASNGSASILVKLFIDGNYIILEVHDNGPGISEEQKEKIFEPFYTTKKDGNGLGLLSLKICSLQHNAEVDVEKSDLGGACFRLRFPVEKYSWACPAITDT